MQKIATVVSGLLVSLGCWASCLAPGSYNYTLSIDGFSHAFALHVPVSSGDSRPLVIQLHGGGSTGAAMALVSGFTSLANSEGFAVLTPEGWAVGGAGGPQVWNAGACCGPTQFAPDHVNAVAAMLDELDAQGACIDPSRVYATGHSNGGMMSYRLACELSDRIAAVAVSAGSLTNIDFTQNPPAEVFACEPLRPVPVLHVHGLQDLCVPYDGSVATSGNTYPAIEPVVAFWRQFNGCGAGMDQRVGEVRRQVWQHCAGDTEVQLVTVDSLGHPWAGSPLYGNPEFCGGSTSLLVSTTSEAWAFFSSHSLPEVPRVPMLGAIAPWVLGTLMLLLGSLSLAGRRR